MKKLIALLLALVMVFALCACGGRSAGTDTQPEEAGTDAQPTEAAGKNEPDEGSDILGEWINQNTGFISFVFEDGGYGYEKFYNAVSYAYSEYDFTWEADGNTINVSVGDNNYIFRIDKERSVLKSDGVEYVPLDSYKEKATITLSDEQMEQTIGREICLEYQKNPIRFDQTYKGCPITVISTIASIDTDRMICYDDNVYTGKIVLNLVGEWCVIISKDNPFLEELAVGDTVLVTGYLSGIGKYGEGIIVDNNTGKGNSIRLYDEDLTSEEQAHYAVLAAEQLEDRLNTVAAFAILDEAIANGYETEELTEYYNEMTSKCFEGTQFFRPDEIYKSYIELESETPLDNGKTEYRYYVNRSFTQIAENLSKYYLNFRKEDRLTDLGTDIGVIIIIMP